MHTDYCFVHKLGESDLCICLAQKEERDACPYVNRHDFTVDRFCTHPKRRTIQKKPLPATHLPHDFEWV